MALRMTHMVHFTDEKQREALGIWQNCCSRESPLIEPIALHRSGAFCLSSSCPFFQAVCHRCEGDKIPLLRLQFWPYSPMVSRTMEQESSQLTLGPSRSYFLQSQGTRQFCLTVVVPSRDSQHSQHSQLACNFFEKVVDCPYIRIALGGGQGKLGGDMTTMVAKLVFFLRQSYQYQLQEMVSAPSSFLSYSNLFSLNCPQRTSSFGRLDLLGIAPYWK